jgi:type I restriction enzyme S subunit
MSFQKYEAYKDSGVEWLGEVPEHWSVDPLKYHAQVFPSNVDKKTYEGQSQIYLCNYTDVYYNDEITADMDFMSATATEDQINKFSLRAGDVIFTKDSETANDIAIAAYVPRDLPGVICGYHLSMVRSSTTVNGAFIKRFFDSRSAKAYFEVSANGLTRVGLGQYATDNIPTPVPPLNEQIQIARFLDHETARIDVLIAEQERLIELLKEKRQAVISHAVTKGLDPTAPMKDSGVEWLGEVPEHWGIGCIKYLSTCISKGTTPTTIGAEFQDNGIRFLKAENIDSGKVTSFPEFYIDENAHEILKRSALAASDVLVVIAGATTGKSAIMPSDILPANTNQAVSFIRLSDSRYAKFVHLWLSTESIQQSIILNSVQSAQPNLSMEDLGNLPIVIPPAKEVRELTTRIYQMIQGCDQLIQEAMIAMDLLQERRSALISAAVTGKIDVRGWQPPASVAPSPVVACG